MSESTNVPTFVPPSDAAPVFTPPKAQSHHNGLSCFYHKNESSVANCTRCGKHLCQDCYDAYGVSAGEYAGQALCYDCTRQIVAENVEQLTENKKTIKFQFILSLIGIVIGFIAGISFGKQSGDAGVAIVYGILFAGIGGVFLSAIKVFFQLLWNSIVAGFEAGFIAGILSFFLSFFIVTFKCLWVTIKNTIFYIQYLKRTSGIIESDQAALREMESYMEYTLVRDRNQGVPLESLMAQGGALANNAYAKIVANEGEDHAEQRISNMVTRIAENGEIIREFAAAS